MRVRLAPQHAPPLTHVPNSDTEMDCLLKASLVLGAAPYITKRRKRAAGPQADAWGEGGGGRVGSAGGAVTLQGAAVHSGGDTAAAEAAAAAAAAAVSAGYTSTWVAPAGRPDHPSE